MNFDLTVNLNFVLAVTTALIGAMGSFFAYRANNRKKILSIHEVLDEAWELIVGEKKDLKKAKRLIELKAYPVKKDFIRTFYVWGILHFEQEEYEIAEKSFLKCLKEHKRQKLDPDPVYEKLVEIYVLTNRFEKAKSTSLEMIEMNVRQAFAYYHLGVVSIEERDFEMAKHYFLKSIEADPEFKNSYSNLIAVALYLKEYESGVLYVDKAIENKAMNQTSYKNAAGLFQVIGNNERAIEMLKQLEGPISKEPEGIYNFKIKTG